MDKKYLEVSQEAGASFFTRNIQGEIVMLNLLRFKKTADYSADPDLKPAIPISGAEAFQRYIDHTLPLLKESGGELEFLGMGEKYLIGPPDEQWDLVMLVRQKSVESFMAFSSNKEYLAVLGHRTAALDDSRLLPLLESKTVTD